MMADSPTRGPSFGELAAIRMVLWDAVNYLTDDKRTLLYEVISSVVADMRVRWGSEPSNDFRTDLLDELQKIAFRLAQCQELPEGHAERVSAFVCIRCDVFATGHGASLSCPSCGTADWLEAWFI